jgi:hypothetical protein
MLCTACYRMSATGSATGFGHARMPYSAVSPQRRLDMSANLLQQLPLGLSYCHRLEELRLHDNNLTVEAFPDALSALTCLTCE